MKDFESRYILDRFSSVHYYPSLNVNPIPYNRQFMNNHLLQIKRRKDGKRHQGGWAMEFPMNNNKDDWIDWYPYGSGSLIWNGNFNRLLCQVDGIEIPSQEVLWGDNFLPWVKDYQDDKAFRKQINVWFTEKDKASNFLNKLFTEHRPQNKPINEECIASMKYLEIALEIKNSWMSEIKRWMETSTKGEVFEYAGRSQSMTAYFRPFRKSDNYHIKGYQKTVDFARIEIAFYGHALDPFKYHKRVSGLTDELLTLVDRTFYECDLNTSTISFHIKEKRPSEIIGFISHNFKLRVSVLMGLCELAEEGGLIESNVKNQNFLRMLRRRNIITPVLTTNHDRTNDASPKTKVRGKFMFTNEFIDLWNWIKEMEK